MTRFINYLRIGLVFLPAIGIFDAHAQDSTGRPMTLDSCVKIGVNNATTVLKGSNEVKYGGIEVLQSYGQFLPDLNGGLGFGYSGGKSYYYTTTPTLVDSKNFGVNYQVVTTLNLFNGLADYSSLKAAIATKQGYQLTLERAKQQIAYDVAQSYLQILLDKQVVDFARQNLKYSTDREKQLQELTRVGRTALSDLYQQQAQTSQDKLFLINAETKWKNDQVLLLQKLRMDVNGTYNFVDPVMDSLPLGGNYLNEQQMLQTALGQRADLKAIDYNLQASDWNIKKIRSGYLPKVGFSYGLFGVSRHINSLSVNGVETPFGPQRSIGTQLGDQVMSSVGLNLTWTLFDKLQTKYTIAAARIYTDNLRIDQQDLQIQIATDLKQAYNNYRAALQQLETSSSGLVAAQQSYETQNGKYNVGAASFIELINAQNTLLQARESKAQALINLMLQKKVIDLYAGNANY